MTEPTPQLPPPSDPPRPAEQAERLSLTITNLIRLGGFALVLKVGLFAPAGTPLDTRLLAVAAFMMAGAQLTDTLLAAFFGQKK
jgi:hypothetical protein